MSENDTTCNSTTLSIQPNEGINDSVITYSDSNSKTLPSEATEITNEILSQQPQLKHTQLPAPNNPPPAPPPTPPLRGSVPAVVRTPEFTSSIPPFVPSMNTTPRQSSSKRYTAAPHYNNNLPERKYSLQQQQQQQNATLLLSKAPTSSNFSITNANHDALLTVGSTSNLLSSSSSCSNNLIQYPQLLVSTTHRNSSPLMKPISQCSMLCCFYAEFDNIVGPKICYQYPSNFMSELDINSTTKQLEDALQHALVESNTKDRQATTTTTTSSKTDIKSQTGRALNPEQQELDGIPAISSSGLTPKATGGRSSKTEFQPESITAAGSSTSSPTGTATQPALPSLSLETTTATTKNIKPASSNNTTLNNNINSSNESSSSTIFDSCSEYIITGSELAGNIIKVSTHNVHLLSHPTILIDEETYERNTLLFSIGFVLRRSIDPQPYKPILSKLVLTIRDMEMESHFLSQRKEQMQLILEGIVRSMNSYTTNGECNIVLGPADVLHLKLFRPPRMHVMPVKDFSVPILVRRDWLHQGYEWDISINWVSMHIDGILNARQISKRAEVDLEMVRACLRVLKHHNVVQLIDIFCYSNRYESTGRIIESDMLHEVVEYVIKHNEIRAVSTGKEVSPPDPCTGINDEHSASKSMIDSFDGDTSIQRMKDESLRSSSLPNNEGGGIVLASSAMTHEDYKEIQTAIIEFYAACHRHTPIGEVWIGFITKRQSTATTGSASFIKNIRWKRIFRLIDHRRLVTFGLIHGYIRRVHNYPLLVNRSNASKDHGPSSSTPRYSNIQRPKSASTHDRIGRGVTNHHQIKNEQEERRKRSMHQATILMDGMHCDDEIVCEVELPFDKILNMFPNNSIVSVFASDDGTN